MDKWTAQYKAAGNVNATLGHYLSFDPLPPALKDTISVRFILFLFFLSLLCEVNVYVIAEGGGELVCGDGCTAEVP